MVIRPPCWFRATSRQGLVLLGACAALATTAAVVGVSYAYAVGVGIATARGGGRS